MPKAPIVPIAKTAGAKRKSPTKVARSSDADLVAVVEAMDAATRERSVEATRNRRARPNALRATLVQDHPKKWRYEFNEPDGTFQILRMSDSFGTSSPDFIDVMMGQLLSIWSANGGVSAKDYNAALAVMEAAKPQTELEAMLVVQMIGAQESAMRCTAMIGKAQSSDQAMAYGNLANKFMRTFTGQMESLSRMRRGGEQIVKHVHVYEGGQAVVAGTINQHQGGGAKGKGAEQAHEQGPPGATLSCPDPARDGMPLPCIEGKEAVPVTRRTIDRCAEGKP